jgi:hypothetical protein
MNYKQIYENLAEYVTTNGRSLKDAVNKYSVDVAVTLETALQLDEITPDGFLRIVDALDKQD